MSRVSQQNQRKIGIDVLKCLAAFSIVTIHIIPVLALILAVVAEFFRQVIFSSLSRILLLKNN